jgi:hypothetical protein
MPMPHADKLLVPLQKLYEYLLDVEHPVGGTKAEWFISQGYHSGNAESLADALIELAQQSETWILHTTRFGVKCVVRGCVITPIGREVWLTTVWFIDNGRVIPRLITAYPSEGPTDDSQRT